MSILIRFASDRVENRVCRLENEYDVRLGLKPRHPYKCFACSGTDQIIKSVADPGEPTTYTPIACPICDGGRLVARMNAELGYVQ